MDESLAWQSRLTSILVATNSLQPRRGLQLAKSLTLASPSGTLGWDPSSASTLSSQHRLYTIIAAIVPPLKNYLRGHSQNM